MRMRAHPAVVTGSGNSAKLTFPGVAPGDYQAYAWTGSPEAFEYANPDARQAWAGPAVSVHIGERDRQSLALKIAAGETQ